MDSSNFIISAAVLDISREATAVKERADFIGRLHSEYVVVVIVYHVHRIGCQPEKIEKNYLTRWPIPLVVC